MTGPSDDGQAGVTEADRETAWLVMARLPISLPGYQREALDATAAVIADALAAERERVLAPFLALAAELESEGRKEEAEAIRYGKAVTAESWWGSSAASLNAADRIRRAAEEGQQ